MDSFSTQISSSTSANERTDKNAYSSTVHKLIVIMNGGAIGLLAVTPTKSADRQATILSFSFIILIYGVLRVCEVKLRESQEEIHYFVGHISHLFGVLAALTLIFLVSPIFTLIVAPLWLLWFFVIIYTLFTNTEIIPGDADHSDQISPV